MGGAHRWGSWHRNLGRTWLVMIVLAALVGLDANPARAATFVVDSVGDAADISPGDGVCATVSGDCTLRAAIQEADALPGEDTIRFAVSESHPMALGSAGTHATGELTIDGIAPISYPKESIAESDGVPAGSVDRPLVGAGNPRIMSLLTPSLRSAGVVVPGHDNRIEGGDGDPATARDHAGSLSAVESISLMVNAFYQSIGAFRLPFVFLGLSLMVLIGLGGATRVPLVLARRARTHWSVVLLDRESALQVYREPALDGDVIYNFNPTTESILSTGKVHHFEGIDWIPVHTPRGDGWVDSFHLTEQVDIEEFMDDPRPSKLARQLAERLRSGGDVGSLIARRGIVLTLTGHPTRLAPEQIGHLLDGERLRRLPTIGGVLQAQDDFRIAVTDPFLAAFDATVEVTPDTAHSQAALIPSEVWNFRYLALGAGSRQPWLIFFEYENGKPRIVGLGIDE